MQHDLAVNNSSCGGMQASESGHGQNRNSYYEANTTANACCLLAKPEADRDTLGACVIAGEAKARMRRSKRTCAHLLGVASSKRHTDELHSSKASACADAVATTISCLSTQPPGPAFACLYSLPLRSQARADDDMCKIDQQIEQMDNNRVLKRDRPLARMSKCL
eukprot:6202003-Pleurochrysis_carterae.AAC.2